MPNPGNKLVALALVGACSFGVWKVGSALLSDEAQATKHAVNHLWIDHAPRDDRDLIGNIIILDHPQGQVGVTGRSSQWRIRMDVFRWQLDGGTLELFFPQDRIRAKVQIETWECAGEAPAPFELCMKVTNPRGASMMFYSREDWKIDPGNAQKSLAKISADEPLLNGALGNVDGHQAQQLGALDLAQAERWPERDGLAL
jgi:hypothetical protein